MDDGRILGEDLPLPPECLFERLSHIPGYSWDSTQELIHTSYDNWHVTGVKLASGPEPPLPTPSTSSRSKESSSAQASPRPDSRPPVRAQWRRSYSESSVSDVSNSGGRVDGEPSWLPVIARVSTNVVRLEREFHMLTSLIQISDPNCEHTIRPLDLIRLNTQPGSQLAAVVYEYYGLNQLRKLVPFGPTTTQVDHTSCQVPLPVFFDFAIGACECLELLHYGLEAIHGEIRPDTFHFNIETRQVRLWNTGNGARSFDNALGEGWSALSKERGVKSKLQYIAPEQTGRLPTEPDTRTDIYAVGVLFYSMLSGAPAFDGSDPIEVVQNVLSKRLPPLASKRIDLPRPVSDVIRKMTQKQMNDRYHTISSVKNDLRRISELLGDGDWEQLDKFEIATRDVSSFFTLPASMFGRQEEFNRILDIVLKVHKRVHASVALHIPLFSNTLPTSLTSSFSDIRESFEQDHHDGASTHSSINPCTAIESAPSTAAPGPSPWMAHAEETGFGLESSMSVQTPKATPTTAPSTASAASAASVATGTTVQPNKTRSPVSAIIGEGSDRDSSSLISLQPQLSHPQFSSVQYDSLVPSGRRKAHSKLGQSGRCEIISITGASGMGKSDLLSRLFSEIRKYGYVGVARLDRSRTTPYEPFLKILTSLLRQIFSERDVMTPYHSAIRSALRPTWSTLHNALGLPEQLIYLDEKDRDTFGTTSYLSVPNEHHGRSRRQTTADSRESALHSSKLVRFSDTFIEVIRILSKYCLICLCLDEIDYADDESVQLLLELTQSNARFVLIMSGTQNERMHPGVRSFFTNESVNVAIVPLRPLNYNEILEYVSATMHQSPNTSLDALAAVVEERSCGIPFYMRMMLETCNRKNCIWYDWKDSRWHYHLDRILREFSGPENKKALGADFVARRFHELPGEARAILVWASLLGSPFSFTLTAHIISGECNSINPFDTDDPTCRLRTCLFYPNSDAVGAGLQHLLHSCLLIPGETDDEYRYDPYWFFRHFFD